MALSQPQRPHPHVHPSNSVCFTLMVECVGAGDIPYLSVSLPPLLASNEGEILMKCVEVPNSSENYQMHCN